MYVSLLRSVNSKREAEAINISCLTAQGSYQTGLDLRQDYDVLHVNYGFGGGYLKRGINSLECGGLAPLWPLSAKRGVAKKHSTSKGCYNQHETKAAPGRRTPRS